MCDRLSQQQGLTLNTVFKYPTSNNKTETQKKKQKINNQKLKNPISKNHLRAKHHNLSYLTIVFKL